jgi:hypothetical protein
MSLIAALRARGRDERGFTMVTVLTVMLSVTLLSIAALAAAQGDLKPGAHDKSRKVAYAAAEAGLQNYLFHLGEDLDYWAKCTTAAQPHAVNNQWNGVSPPTDPRNWSTLTGGQSRYALELLPANGHSACSTATPDATMIDVASGNFKVRSTGQDVTNQTKRSIVATFRRKGFLDYLYFTDKETLSPSLYGYYVPSRTTYENPAPGPGSRDLLTWARDCDRYWGTDPARGNRGGYGYDGKYVPSSGTPTIVHTPVLPCDGSTLQQGDRIAGPMHTNDEFRIECGTGDPPRLGNSADDVIETSSAGQLAVSPADPDAGWRGASAGCAPPQVNFSTSAFRSDVGTWKARAPALELPPTNAALRNDTAAAYQFEGTTRITMSGTSMHVSQRQVDGTYTAGSDMAIPADGVVYVANHGACPAYDAAAADAAPPACGNLELHGDYAANVTFTAENDIVVTGDVVRSTGGPQFMLGLLAQNFVRVNHPVSGCSPAGTCNWRTGCTNAAGTMTNVNIEAAILSLSQSFMVDNWFCGAQLGELHITGAIAQKFRGPVNRDNVGLGTSGYQKVYSYDSRLKYRSPPHFLDPVQAQWRVQLTSEQVPAR